MTKQELLAEARKISALHEEKKAMIKKIFDDLDKEEKTTEKHINGMAAVNIILQEMTALETEHANILLKIKT